MRLGTRQECVGSSPRVSGVCQDGVREFARRKLRLTGRLSMVAEKLVGRATELQPDDEPRSSLSIGPGFGRCSGISLEFARRFAEGIMKLAGNTPEDRWKKTERLSQECQRLSDWREIQAAASSFRWVNRPGGG
ncbi:hypothetical protein GW17_00062438 [Ensete ventricosum]|nr:hypothetical protein GW17_00062438 [Ensete ventricosum]